MYKKIPAFILAAVFIFALPHLLALRPLIVLSGSMEPAIHTGSLIFIDTKKKDPLPGDIITIRLTMAEGRNTLVTHRVIRMEDGLPITKGDANETEDHIIINPAQIVGTYVFQIPYLGYLVSYFRQSLNKFLSMYLS